MTTPSAPQEGSEYGPQADLDHDLAVRRWRMVLGRYAQSALPRHPEDADLDGTLGYLYDREYTERGHRLSDSGAANRDGAGRGGGLEASALRAVDWLDGARRLFPASTIERLERDALTRYGLSDLLADPDAVDSIRTSPELGAALLRIKGTISPALADGLRTLIARIVADVLERLRRPMTTALTGARQRHRRSPHASARNFDWRRTIAANLGHADPRTGRLLVEEVRFMSRQRRHNVAWDIIIVVDQSASMSSSLLHSAVMASILAALPGMSVRLILFDTSVVDVSHLVHDPVEILMTSQLGGGTDIANAVGYAAAQVTQPTRTVLALVSDFEEGGSVSSLVTRVRGLADSGVTMLGLASLTDDGAPWFDRTVADKLAAVGMRIAAMTPDRFADWLAEATA
ncbi:VWA domain-containing protein [Actinomyces massiliensis]|uniref:VWA domain-containing protein n=1 Tax=Actinomyces massiliensis TaxID=461393 RepID=UPI00031ECDFC|nr:VWA domain-containing protein [Actinomyces massiliensis]